MHENIKSQKPARGYSTFTVTSIVVANMIGAGIFTTSGILAGSLPGAGWVLLCWIIGGLIALAGALTYTELASRIPESGGEYAFLKNLYNPMTAFLTGWTSFIVGFSAPIALSAMSFSEYFAGSLYNITGWQASKFILKAMAVIIILLFTAVHYLGQKVGSRIQNILTVLKVLVLSWITGFGLSSGNGDFSRILKTSTGEPFSLLAFGSAMIIVMYSYSGWNAASYITEEVNNPRKTLPVSLISGTLVVTILYLLINLFIFYATPYQSLQGQIPVVEIAAVGAFGSWFGGLLGGIVSLLLLSSLSAYLIIGPRVCYKMAEDGLFLKTVSRIHPRHQVPSYAVLTQGMLASLLVIVGSFEQLLVYIGFALGIFPLLAVYGLFKARKLRIGEESAVKTIGYPFTPFFYLLTSGILMIASFIHKTLESSIAVATVLIGIPIYFIWIKTKTKK